MSLSADLTPEKVLKAAKKHDWHYGNTCRELGFSGDTGALRRAVMKWGYRNWIDYRIKNGGPTNIKKNQFETVWEGGEPELIRLAEQHDWNQVHMANAVGCSPDVFLKRCKKLGYRNWAEFKEKQGQRPALTLDRIYKTVQTYGTDGYMSARHASLKLGYKGNAGAIVSYVQRNGYAGWNDFLARHQPSPEADANGQFELGLAPEKREDDELVSVARSCGWQMDLVTWKLGYDNREQLLERLRSEGYKDWSEFYTKSVR